MIFILIHISKDKKKICDDWNEDCKKLIPRRKMGLVENKLRDVAELI